MDVSVVVAVSSITLHNIKINEVESKRNTNHKILKIMKNV